MLLTVGDTEDRRRYINAREVFDRLLAMDALPLLMRTTKRHRRNSLCDNDRLAARVAE